MALVDPSVDKLVLLSGSKYALSVLVAKRAKKLAVSRADYFNDNRAISPISVAAQEFVDGDIVMNKY